MPDKDLLELEEDEVDGELIDPDTLWEDQPEFMSPHFDQSWFDDLD